MLKRLPRTMTLTDITTQKISFKASASRLTDAGRKSYLFSAKWSSIEDDSQQYLMKQCIDSLCILPLKVRVACVIYLMERWSHSLTSIGWEFQQENTTGPKSYKAQTQSQSIGWRAGAQPGAGVATHHGEDRDWMQSNLLKCIRKKRHTQLGNLHELRARVFCKHKKKTSVIQVTVCDCSSQRQLPSATWNKS